MRILSDVEQLVSGSGAGPTSPGAGPEAEKNDLDRVATATH